MEHLDDEFEDDGTQDEVVVDYITGFYERKSDCHRYKGGWTIINRKTPKDKPIQVK